MGHPLDFFGFDGEIHQKVDRLRAVLFDEGLAKAQEAEGLLENYSSWTKGRCLMNLGLTHAFQHVGEIGVIAGLLGLDL